MTALEFAETPASPLDYLPVSPPSDSDSRLASGDLETEVAALVDYVGARGFVFEPWQVAAFITAVRTKPFVILAGISGTGKTRLPRLIGDATGAHTEIVPVRPDWIDSSDLLGYHRLDHTFIPGPLLRAARRALDQPDRQHLLVLDEMNLARVEYYLAEVLSRLEDRERDETGSIVTAPLLPSASSSEQVDWAAVTLPPNLCIVGSVNMDETTHGFSRKVLDRSFVIEFSDIDLTNIPETAEKPSSGAWPTPLWRQEYLRLGEFPNSEDVVVLDVIGVLNAINDYLTPAQLQVGYRVRDEIVLFCVHARACRDSFVTFNGDGIDPLDLVLTMKVLPRIQGGGNRIRGVLNALLLWAQGAHGQESVAQKPNVGSPATRTFPMCAARLQMMLQRLDDVGFTSYWL